MALEPGTRLGPYQISAQIGAGGMGEVYKATDTRLNRTVAVKVLPAHFSSNPEMKQRFDREAQTVAGLNHPNICTLHDIGRDGETDFLVMEYLEGETLAARLQRGPMPLGEALKAAIQIADALEKAHARGVTHRDLKPGNVMLTEGGAKLLDFGLAKLQPAAATSPHSSVTTPRTPSTTTPGTVLGTMQYMSPEQLEGKEADGRTDLFAFGAVLYEMVTGRKAFEGKSQPHLIAAIVSVQPEPITSLKPDMPPALDFLVRRCLEKDPEQRLQTATDLLHELRWIAGGSSGAVVPVPFSRRQRQRATLARVALAVSVIALLVMAGLAWRGSRTPAVSEEATRFTIDVSDMPVPEAVAISPDGRTVAYAAREGGSTAVFVRPVDVEVATKLPGTEGAGRLFWSPDSRRIAFFAAGRLKRVDAEGGPARNVADTPDLLGGTWNAQGDILFASTAGLQRVLAEGGQPSMVTVTGDGNQSLPGAREPHFLPDGNHFLFLAGDAEKDAAIYVASLDVPVATRLVSAPSNPVYARSNGSGDAAGYLLFHRQGTLYAQPFDAGSRSLDGEAVRITDGLPVGRDGAAAFAASADGVLVYRNAAVRTAAPSVVQVSETGIGTPPPIVWTSGNGQAEPAGDAARWISVDLSPDGRRFAAHKHEADGGDIWLFDVGERTPTRFTFDASQDNSMPVWSPDGSRIAFASRRTGSWGLYVKAADNTQAEQLILETEHPALPMSWSPDGQRLVYSVSAPETFGDVWSVAMDAGAGKREGTPILRTPADERNPQVSPDGHWLAYSSNETGRSEIYVRSFPEGAARIQVSVDGGVYPRWRRDGRELYFLNLVSIGGMMASEVRFAGASVQRSVPRRLFQSNFVTQSHAGGAHHAYAVTADGGRFLIPQFDTPAGAFGGSAPVVAAAVLPGITADRHASASASSGLPITVVFDWTAVVRR